MTGLFARVRTWGAGVLRPYKWFGMVLTGLKTRRYKNKKDLRADGRLSRVRASPSRLRASRRPSLRRKRKWVHKAKVKRLVEAGGYGFYYGAVGVVVFEGPHEGAAEAAGGAEVDVAHF
jgi:hypothetical protein